MYAYVGLVFAPVRARSILQRLVREIFSPMRALQNRASENGCCIIARCKLAQRATSHIYSAAF
jgi:hypothetical protein